MNSWDLLGSAVQAVDNVRGVLPVGQLGIQEQFKVFVLSLSYTGKLGGGGVSGAPIKIGFLSNSISFL